MVTVHIDPARMQEYAARVGRFHTTVRSFRDTYREPGHVSRAGHLAFRQRRRTVLSEMREVMHFWQVELSDDEKQQANPRHDRDEFKKLVRVAKKIANDYVCIMRNQPNSPVEYTADECQGNSARSRTRRRSRSRSSSASSRSRSGSASTRRR
jgi:hypothetical protein